MNKRAGKLFKGQTRSPAFLSEDRSVSEHRFKKSRVEIAANVNALNEEGNLTGMNTPTATITRCVSTIRHAAELDRRALSGIRSSLTEKLIETLTLKGGELVTGNGRSWEEWRESRSNKIFLPECQIN